MLPTILAERYRLESRIATGAMGEVWRGEDLALRRPVAIKLMRRYAADNQAAVTRFAAEARCAAQLTHRGIARIYDYCDSDQPFLVMELVDGPSLAAVLASGPLAPWRALDVVGQVATALHAIHSAGIVHRDLKPANLLLSDAGEIKLTDFGIAYSMWSAPLTQAESVVGTAEYLAPERIGGRPATPASDLYSLGVVLYECLVAARPFTGTMFEVALAHCSRALPPLPLLAPAGIMALVADLTAKDPAARPRDAAVVATRAWVVRDELLRLRTRTGIPAARARPATTGPNAPQPAAPQRAPLGLQVITPRKTAERAWLPARRRGIKTALIAACLAVAGSGN